MSKHHDLRRVLDGGIVAIIRAASSEQLVEVAQALYDGGIDVIEVTFTVPNVLEILSQVRLLPTGGVNLTTLPDFLKAGACAVGLGTSLVEPQALQVGDMDRIRNLAQQYVQLVQTTRQGL